MKLHNKILITTQNRQLVIQESLQYIALALTKIADILQQQHQPQILSIDKEGLKATPMRVPTIEEQEAIDKYCDKISKSTGINFYDVLEEIEE